MSKSLGESPKLPISVLVQTKNEEAGILACLQNLTDFAEVIVVDSNSTDQTARIARDFGATVVNFSWDGGYPKKKQWQLDNLNTAHPWVLFLDADEFPTRSLVSELAEFPFHDPSIAAGEIRLDYRFSGKVLRHGHTVRKRALVHRDRNRFPVFDDLGITGMGELEGHYQPHPKGAVLLLKARLLHDDHDPVRTWFDRHNRYSDWEAALRFRPRTRSAIAGSRSRNGKLFDAAPFKAPLFFVYCYIARMGFLDGRAGLDYAIALSAYYWQIDVKYRELRRERFEAK